MIVYIKKKSFSLVCTFEEVVKIFEVKIDVQKGA